MYPASLFIDTVIKQFTPAKWWKILSTKVSTAQGSPLPVEFCEFVSNLQNVPVSSASIERIFSNFGFIWSKLRNRLGTEKVAKLAKVYRYFRDIKDD